MNDGQKNHQYKPAFKRSGVALFPDVIFKKYLQEQLFKKIK